MWITEQIKGMAKKKKEKWLLENASKLEITDLMNLCYWINNIPKVDFVASNAFYGHAYHLKKYADINQDLPLNCVITHGMDIIARYACEIEVSHPVSTILTYSQHRKEILEDVSCMKAISIGPSIAYARDYCTNEEFERKKQEFGKTLLVFPIHGVEGANVQYNVDDFCMEIDDVGKKFDTIMVCLHHNDIKAGLDKFYSRKGYMVVCAGVVTDKYFLSRQRMILQLSDAVIGNDFTTGLAYALYFDKPVYIFRQPVKFENKSSNNFTQLHTDNSLLEEFCALSNDKTFNNLKAQKKWGSYYLGLDDVKSQIEMKELLKSFVRE